MIKTTVIAITATVLLAACGGPEKKVLVMSRGTITVNGNLITIKDGTGHAEQEVTVSGNAITIDKDGDKKDVAVTETGYYILNYKSDTVIGAKQKLGVDLNNKGIITQEQMQGILDSLNNLVLGKNVSAANQNYFILPGNLQKISANVNARVYGPFRKIAAEQQLDDDGKEPEIYKFYTNREMRDQIEAKSKMLIGKD
jgi:hypothetical protein